MKEWNVYINGKYVGTVDARDEASARLAAISRYEPGDEDSISVNRR